MAAAADYAEGVPAPDLPGCEAVADPPIRGGVSARTVVASIVPALVAATALVGCAGESSSATATPEPTTQATATAPADPADAVTNGIDELPVEQALERSISALVAASSFRVTGAPTAGAPLDLVFVSGTPLQQPAEPSPRPPGEEAGRDETDAATGDGSEDGSDAATASATVAPAEDGEPASSVVGRGATGTVSRDGSTFELLAIDGVVYVRGNLDWLAAAVDEDARRTVGEKWLLLPQQAAASLALFTDPAAFAEAVLEPTGPVQSVGVSLIDSEPALGVRSLGTESTTWLAGTGVPYPVLVERLGATAADGVLRFYDVDADVELTAPEPDAVVVVPEPSAEDDESA